MQFKKSYRLLRYLNQRHSAISRYVLGALAWLGTWLFTQSVILAGLMRREFIEDDFRLAFRRAAWFARHVLPRLDFFEDPFFDFTMQTNAQQREELMRFLQRYRMSSSHSSYLTDVLYIRAADIHGQLEAYGEGLDLSDQVVAFYDNADEVLSALATPRPVKQQDGRQRKDDFSRINAVTALRDLAEALPLEDWPWYVISGTFLGLHREGGFLAHDYDIDVGVNAEDISVERLVAVLAAHSRFVTKKVDFHIEIKQDEQGLLYLEKTPALIKLIHENGLNLDVFIHHTENNRCWHGSIIHRWENSPFALVKRELEGIPVYAPDDADRYLTENYGAWCTPVKDFDCTTGTPNLVVSQNFLSVALFLKSLVIFCESDSVKAEKLRNTLVSSSVIEEGANGLRVVRSFERANNYCKDII